MKPSGKNVLVTRPGHQAPPLCRLLTAAGFNPIPLPTIDIVAMTENASIDNRLKSLSEFDYIVFISANAVTQANVHRPQWPSSSHYIAIGPKTADTMSRIGIQASTISAKPFNSEQLITQLPFALTGKRILIIKGQGGRDFLADAFRNKGMLVDTLDVYQRKLPICTPAITPTLPIDYVTITSNLALKHLTILLPNDIEFLKKNSTFVVFSQRIANYAKELGCQHIVVSDAAHDAGLLNAIIKTKA
ncbi:MAG: uroporphyrinogen-III synthase [Piscirickettsiaceae bacterium]|nr:MAG: uroporphyrinogen-III synthase [Piscirickettsiaceae bacterium]